MEHGQPRSSQHRNTRQRRGTLALGEAEKQRVFHASVSAVKFRCLGNFSRNRGTLLLASSSSQHRGFHAFNACRLGYLYHFRHGGSDGFRPFCFGAGLLRRFVGLCLLCCAAHALTEKQMIYGIYFAV